MGFLEIAWNVLGASLFISLVGLMILFIIRGEQEEIVIEDVSLDTVLFEGENEIA